MIDGARTPHAVQKHLPSDLTSYARFLSTIRARRGNAVLDIKTGMLVWCSQGFALAGFLYLLWRQHRRARFYLMWSLGFLLSTVGFGLTLGRDYLPHLVAIALAHAIALSGYALWITGFCLLEKRKLSWTALLPPAIWLSGIFLPWVSEDMLNRVALFHLANATGASLLIGSLSRSTGSGEPAARQLSTAFAAISVFSFAVALAIAVRHFSAEEAMVVAAVGAFGNGILQLLAIALSIRLVMLRSERRWHNLSVTDPLTGTLNRRGLQDAFAKVKDDSRNENLAALLFDLDRFKLINDRFGHQAGDDVLVAFTQTARRFIPSAAATVHDSVSAGGAI
ncbi:GGDEF domain-containing protein [Rhizobium sp. RAF56]|uniref:GGDEF domain-containing protein n=1 Tax=Rhizobium sp. RAF56 TaxID=3233062 RepID=UPI003F955EB9